MASLEGIEDFEKLHAFAIFWGIVQHCSLVKLVKMFYYQRVYGGTTRFSELHLSVECLFLIFMILRN